MKWLRTTGHVIRYIVWLLGQIIKESVVMASDTFTTGRNIAPVIVYYPLRVTKERDVAFLISSVTMTPGTLALGVTGPREVDEDAAAGKRSTDNVAATGSAEFRTHGLPRVQRFLAVHAMYGSDPHELLHSLAVMEGKLVPSVRKKKPEFDVEHLTERGVPGPRGYRGTHGGRASEDGTFDIDKVDSTPHATAFVAAIMRQEDELDEADLPDLTREERERIAREHARKAGEHRAAETKRKREARAAKAAQQAEEVDSSVYERAAEGLLTGPFGVVRRPDDVGTAVDGGDGGDGAGKATGADAERPGTAAAAEAGRRHPGRHSTSAGIGPLVNAYELRSKFPQPPLYLSSRKNRKDPRDPRNRKKGKR